MNFQLVDLIFSRIGKALRFLETAEKREVVRCLRDIYFYPDGLLKILNELIETSAADPEKAIALGAALVPKDETIQEALAFITSPSVASNLTLSVKMVEELRRIAGFKSGVRSKLHAIFFIWTFEQDRQAVLRVAKEAKDEIAFLNEKIRELEKNMVPD